MAVHKLQIFGFLGLLVSCYAIYVETQAHSEAGLAGQFKAMCDLGEGMSCTRVLTSKWAKMLGLIFNLPENHPLNVPNTYLGILFYFAVVLYPAKAFRWVPARKYLLLVASLMSLASSAYLIYILSFVLHDFCVVCVSTHIANTLIFFATLVEFRTSNSAGKTNNKSV